MGNRVSTGGSFPFYIFHFLATSSRGFWAKGHTQSLAWTLSWFLLLLLFLILTFTVTPGCLLSDNSSFTTICMCWGCILHCFVFTSTIFSLPLYYPGSWCKIPVLISQAAFVFGYWKRRCIISHLGYPRSFQAHLWTRWIMQDLAQSPSPAFLL